MCGIHDDQIDTGVDQALGSLKTALADRGCRRDPQPAMRILAGQRMRDRLLHVLDGDETDAAILVVDDQ